jgi:hypothetical protein
MFELNNATWMSLWPHSECVFCVSRGRKTLVAFVHRLMPLFRWKLRRSEHVISSRTDSQRFPCFARASFEFKPHLTLALKGHVWCQTGTKLHSCDVASCPSEDGALIPAEPTCAIAGSNFSSRFSTKSVYLFAWLFDFKFDYSCHSTLNCLCRPIFDFFVALTCLLCMID